MQTYCQALKGVFSADTHACLEIVTHNVTGQNIADKAENIYLYDR